MILRAMRFHFIRRAQFNIPKLLHGTQDFIFSAMRQIFFVSFVFICGIYFLRYNTYLERLKKPTVKTWTQHKIFFNEQLELEILTDQHYQVRSMGHLGEGTKLKGQSKEQGDQDLKEKYMNVELSKRLPYDRALKDYRDPDCLNNAYDLDILPKSSCIIVFYNEPYSVLVRTVWSVTHTAPERLLREIILVDDGSDSIELKDKLDYFIGTRLINYNIRILRLPKRTGLIQARLAGVRNATQDMIVFLDAHCECTPHWLEPLAARIKDSRKNVAVPLIDNIIAETFEYDPLELDESTGGFSWDGFFTWNGIPKRELARLTKVCGSRIGSCPIETPTMVGGLFAMDRNYFWELGSYDEQMRGWGGENLEMSFRIWQCGGRIESIPCSRIGHVYRANRPYENNTTEDTHSRNTLRMARVWMDEYIEFIYAFKPELKKIDSGDISDRLMVRKTLGCKSFDWYLKNIYPEKFIPLRNAQHYGRFQPKYDSYLCVDVRNAKEFDFYTELPVELHPCERDSVNITQTQFITLTNEGVLRAEEDCFVKSKENGTSIAIILCRLNEDRVAENLWNILDDNHSLQHVATKLCLDRVEETSTTGLILSKCLDTSKTQHWMFNQ